MSKSGEIILKIYKIQTLDNKGRDNRIFYLVLFSAFFLGILFIDPMDVSFLSCSLQGKTGYSCLSCGLSRSLFAVAHLNFGEAFSYHLMGPLLYLSAIILLLKSSLELLINKDVKFLIGSAFIKLILVLFITGWIINWIFNFFR